MALSLWPDVPVEPSIDSYMERRCFWKTTSDAKKDQRDKTCHEIVEEFNIVAGEERVCCRRCPEDSQGPLIANSLVREQSYISKNLARDGAMSDLIKSGSCRHETNQMASCHILIFFW